MTFEVVRPSETLKRLTKEQRIKALKRSVPGYVREADSDCRVIMDYYQQIMEGGYWKDLADSEEQYFMEYCKKPKAWFEAIRDKLLTLPKSEKLTSGQFDASRAVALAENPKPLNETPGATGLNQHSTPEDRESYYNHNNNSKLSRQGTDPEYLAARLARDHPEILERVKAGEFPSMRAAAVAAGIVKPRKQFTVGHSTDPQDFAIKLSDELDHDFLVQLVAALNELVIP
jgi:hypothetical protein